MPNMGARLIEVARSLISQRQIICIAIDRRIDPVRSLQQRNSVSVSAGVKIKFTKFMISSKTPRSAGKSRTQVALGLFPYLAARQTRSGIARTLVLQRDRLTREIFARPQHRI